MAASERGTGTAHSAPAMGPIAFNDIWTSCTGPVTSPSGKRTSLMYLLRAGNVQGWMFATSLTPRIYFAMNSTELVSGGGGPQGTGLRAGFGMISTRAMSDESVWANQSRYDISPSARKRFQSLVGMRV